jgi:tRNA (guanosine-2'-O-)-methyltransferase
MTPERWRHLRAVLDRRQPDLTVLMDNVHKPHNLSAVVRSCDAVGVLEAHAVGPSPALRPQDGIASGSAKWVKVRAHASIGAAIEHLHGRNFQVLAAHRSAQSIDFRAVDYARPTAILLGAELQGVSAPALALADGHIAVPMVGMVESLNVSVAAAIILFEAQRQRHAAGLYDRPLLDPARYAQTLFEWGHPEVAAYCRRRRLPYPRVDVHGNIIEPLADRRRPVIGASSSPPDGMRRLGDGCNGYGDEPDRR